MGKQQANVIFLYNLPMSAQKTKMMLTIMNISIAVRPSAWNVLVENSDKLLILQQQTFGILLVMLLKILTRTRKTVTRIVILPGTLSGGTRKLGKNLINFLKKQGNWERIWLTFFFEKRRKLEKGINQLCWNPFSPQGSRRKLERIRSTFHEQYFTWSRIRWQTCRLENSRWWCSGTFSSSESAGSRWQSNFLGRGNFDIYRPQYIL